MFYVLYYNCFSFLVSVILFSLKACQFLSVNFFDIVMYLFDYCRTFYLLYCALIFLLELLN